MAAYHIVNGAPQALGLPSKKGGKVRGRDKLDLLNRFSLNDYLTIPITVVISKLESFSAFCISSPTSSQSPLPVSEMKMSS